MISQGRAGDHGRILKERKHYRSIHQTPEIPGQEDLDFLKEIQDSLGTQVGFVDRASNSWYKFESEDVHLLLRPGRADEQLTVLSKRSSVVSGLKAVECSRIYVPHEKSEELRQAVAKKRAMREDQQ